METLSHNILCSREAVRKWWFIGQPPLLQFVGNIDEAKIMAMGFSLSNSWGKWGAEWAGSAPRLQDGHTPLRVIPKGTDPLGEACTLGSARGGDCPASHPAAAPALRKGEILGPWGGSSADLVCLSTFVNGAQFLPKLSSLFVLGWVLKYKF